MKKVSILIPLFALFIMFSNQEGVSANSFENFYVSSTDSTIGITFNDSYNYATVIDSDGNLYGKYTSNEENIVISKLIPLTHYRFYVTMYDENDEILDQILVSTNTTDLLMKTTSADQVNLNSTMFVSREGVKINWDAANGANEYKIYKNGEYLASTKEPQYIEQNISKNDYTVYEVLFEVPLSEDEKQKVRKHYEDLGIKLSEERLDEISNKSYSIVKVVEPNSNIQPLASTEKSFKWTYKTFIPMQYADDPEENFLNWGQGIKYFGGDNRGFSRTSEKYRTKVVGDSIFYSGSTTAHEAWFEDVSATTAYDKDKKLLATEKISKYNLDRTVISKTSSMVDTMTYHKVGNPFAISIATIDYNLRAKTYKNGNYSFSGVHDRAPAHELYLRIDNTTHVTIFEHDHEGFDYLFAPSTLARTFSVTN